jgi:hypothetical protein
VLFEAGLMFRRWPNYGTLEVCARYVIPTFSLIRPSFGGSGPEVTVPFFLFGLKAGF